MKKLLKKNQKICLVSQDIKGALSTKVNRFVGGIVEVTVEKEDIGYYKVGDVIEMFTVVDDGMLYFKPTVKEIDEQANVVKAEFDKKTYSLLQRREYTRVDFEKEFKLQDSETGSEYPCTTLDISAGGMKLVTDAHLVVDKDYLIEFSLENEIPISCFFRPIRVDEIKDQSTTTVRNIVCGRFVLLKNIDKIAIVQFCFRKQMETKIK